VWRGNTFYKVRWDGYDKKDDTWEPITHLQGHGTMVKSFKESHVKDQSIRRCRLVMTKESSPDDDDTYRKHE
jgi:hypothetical protein